MNRLRQSYYACAMRQSAISRLRDGSHRLSVDSALDSDFGQRAHLHLDYGGVSPFRLFAKPVECCGQCHPAMKHKIKRTDQNDLITADSHSLLFRCVHDRIRRLNVPFRGGRAPQQQ